MNLYKTPNTNDRPQFALEIALHARIREREMALLEGEYQARKAESKKKGKNFLQVLFSSLFLS